MKKFVSLLLVLIMVCSVLPVTAFAFNPAEYKVIMKVDNKWYGFKTGNKDEKGVDITKDYKAFLKAQKEKEECEEPVHEPGEHEYSWAHNMTFHWLQCPCGCQINKGYHVDPKETADDYCSCGYHFSDNADLVTLWLQDCEGLKNFRYDKYEYETDAFTYKDVKKIKKIATRTFDAGATVEIPEDLTLQEGENKIEIKVTAENQKVTKTYTVIVNKEPKK